MSSDGLTSAVTTAKWRAAVKTLTDSGLVNVLQGDGSVAEGEEDELRCARCGISIRFPGVSFDSARVCSICRAYALNRERIDAYFGSMRELAKILAPRVGRDRGKFDCLLLYSGGKDSTYALYQLVEIGLSLMTFTFDNGFISHKALDNISRVTKSLGVKHIIFHPTTVKSTLKDSLSRYSTPCAGCFKGLLENAVTIADENQIPFIVTGLSRGQIIQERLQWFHERNIFDPKEIDRLLEKGRLVYHQTTAFAGMPKWTHSRIETLERVHTIDFYRYTAVGKQEILSFLQTKDSKWEQPTDCGFCSTNCLINDPGIALHKQTKGYHNYEGSNAWEVRLGHVDLNRAVEELTNIIDVAGANRMLRALGVTNILISGSLDTRPAIRCMIKANVTDRQVKSHLDRQVPGWTDSVRIRYAGTIAADDQPENHEMQGSSSACRKQPGFGTSDSGGGRALVFGDLIANPHAHSIRDYVLLAFARHLTGSSVRRVLLAVLLDNPIVRAGFDRRGGDILLQEYRPLTPTTLCEINLRELPIWKHRSVVERLIVQQSSGISGSYGRSTFQAIVFERGDQLPMWVLLRGTPLLLTWSRWQRIISDLECACTDVASGKALVLERARVTGRRVGESNDQDLGRWRAEENQPVPYLPRNRLRLKNHDCRQRGAEHTSSAEALTYWAGVARSLSAPGSAVELVDFEDKLTVLDGFARDSRQLTAKATRQQYWLLPSVGVRLVPFGKATLPCGGFLEALIDPGGRWISGRAAVQLVVELGSEHRSLHVHYDDATDPDALVKALDACGLSGRKVDCDR
jgi:hypothetical protein